MWKVFNYGLLTSSSDKQLLDNLENDIEDLVKDKEEMVINLFALNTQKQILEERVIQLENIDIDYHQERVSSC